MGEWTLATSAIHSYGNELLVKYLAVVVWAGKVNFMSSNSAVKNAATITILLKMNRF